MATAPPESSLPASAPPLWLVRGLALLCIGLWASLLLTQSQYLQRWDSGQFALALEQMDVRLHQPHPPGYPAYIWAAKLLKVLTLGEANKAMLFLNWFLTGGAAWAAWLLGRRWAGPVAGLVCAALVLASPLTRYYASVALTYPAGLCWFAWLGYASWMVLRERDRRWWMPWLVIAIGGAFRLPTLVLGTPLLALVWWKSDLKTKIVAPLLTLAILFAAYVPVWDASGGFAAWRAALASEGIKHELRFGRWNTQPLQELKDNWGAYKQFFWQGYLLPIPVVLGGLMALVVKPRDDKAGADAASSVPTVVAELGEPGNKTGRVVPLDFLLWWTLPGFIFYLAVHVNFVGILLDYSVPVALVLCCGGKRLSFGKSVPQAILALIMVVLCLWRFDTAAGPQDLGRPLIRAVDELMAIHVRDIPQAGPSASTLLMVGETFKQDGYYLPGYRVIWDKYLLRAHGPVEEPILTMQRHQLERWVLEGYRTPEGVTVRYLPFEPEIQTLIVTSEALGALDPSLHARAIPVSERSTGVLARIDVTGFSGLLAQTGGGWTLATDPPSFASAP